MLGQVNPEAGDAFQSFKQQLCSAPTLVPHDPKLHVIVKADADVNGTGCNWEVMTVKLALEKWGNWLEGAVVD